MLKGISSTSRFIVALRRGRTPHIHSTPGTREGSSMTEGGGAEQEGTGDTADSALGVGTGSGEGCFCSTRDASLIRFCGGGATCPLRWATSRAAWLGCPTSWLGSFSLFLSLFLFARRSSSAAASAFLSSASFGLSFLSGSLSRAMACSKSATCSCTSWKRTMAFTTELVEATAASVGVLLTSFA